MTLSQRCRTTQSESDRLQLAVPDHPLLATDCLVTTDVETEGDAHKLHTLVCAGLRTSSSKPSRMLPLSSRRSRQTAQRSPTRQLQVGGSPAQCESCGTFDVVGQVPGALPPLQLVADENSTLGVQVARTLWSDCGRKMDPASCSTSVRYSKLPCRQGQRFVGHPLRHLTHPV